MTTQTCIIVGASHAAAQLAPSLRQEGWEGRILVIGDEPFLPYHRPPLSKEFLAGKKGIDEVLIRQPAIYDKTGIHFNLGVRVEAIDRDRKRLTLDNGETLPYDKLALTLGSRVRKIPLPGSDLPGVFYLRTIADVEQIKGFVGSGKKAVIVGGGYIGLETAAVLRQLGMQVTVLEMLPRVLQRVTAPELSAFYTRVHAEEGVAIKTERAVQALEGEKQVEAVLCEGGERFAADLVIIGAGIVPNVELAEAAGLAVDNGIVVDRYARSSDPEIVAAGDCTVHENALYGRTIRLESVQNAVDQAKVAAATLCGKEKPYEALPWFWSDQYDIKLQIAGLSQGYDETVIRGDIAGSRSFAVFYLREGVVIAVDAVNKPQEFMLGKRLITGKIPVDKKKLADVNIPMKELV